MLDPRRMKGRVIAIPALNTLGIRSYFRTAPDPSFYFLNNDLNLAFSGNAEGDFMEQAASNLFEQIRAHANYMIDLHSFGIFGFIWSGWSLCYDDESKYSQQAVEIAKAFGLENIVATDFKSVDTEGYTVSHGMRMPLALATSLGIPSIIVEAGGGIDCALNDDVARTASEAVLNVMKYIGMIEGEPRSTRTYTISKRPVDVKAKHGGIFIPHKRSGASVRKGEIIGTIMNVFGEKIEDVKAPVNAVILAHQLYPFVSAGVLLFHFGTTASE